MKIIRRKTKTIKIGSVYIGGTNPIAIQSMTKAKTSDIEKTIRQIKELEKADCQIVRLAVKDSDDARAIKKIKPRVNIPLVADIHFNWRLALEAIDSGIDKIRLNPGNIYKKEQIREIAGAAKLNRIPIRVGVNSGSLKSHKSGVTGQASQADKMVKSTLDYIKILEGFKFYDIVVSLKASNILDTVEAYRKMAKLCEYPFHLGVTATGLPQRGAIKSSIAIGALLLEGIGDTIRVSLTDKPEPEVYTARGILESLGLRYFGPEIISCPTCGRCEVDLVSIVKKMENLLSRYPVIPLSRLTGKRANGSTGSGSTGSPFALSEQSESKGSPSLEPSRAKSRDGQTGKPFKVAIMGCVVNGPGEAREADIGVAFGRKEGLLFRNGQAIKKVSFSNCIATLLKELRHLKNHI